MSSSIDVPPAKTASATPTTPPAARRRRRFGPWRLAALLALAATASLLEPRVFRFAVRQLITLEAWRHGAGVRIERVEGSLYEPVRLVRSHWSYQSRAGAVTRVEIARAEAEFAWRSMFSRNGGRWFQRLTLEGVNGKVQLPPVAADADALAGAERKAAWALPSWSAPARIEARDVDFMVQSNGDHVRFEGSRWTISEMELGVIEAARVVVRQPWLSRTFRDVRGTTALKESELRVAGLALEPGIEVKSFTANLKDLARSRLAMRVAVGAFGGDISVQAQTFPRDRVIEVDATGDFSRIAVGPLATFLGWSEAAGGTIKSGTITFRGSPRHPARASTTLRLEATNFQWESRQWDSLVLGATLLGGRVQVPELELRQGQNKLSLNGELAIPAAWSAWWESDFNFNIAARIENLTELSALMLPEFKFAAGKVSIDGAVRGRERQFHGALFALGHGITWRNAPIEELYAAVKLNGNELQVAKLELLNGDDFVRGRGVINILGAKQYWGELRGSVEELGAYAALLQKPIVPEPLAGGASIQWAGEGSAKGHSGKFSARLEKLRSLGATGAMLHPVRAELDGHYAPDWVQFGRFSLSDDESAFSANVTVGPKTLSLRSIRLTHGPDVWLQGEAILPLDLWKAWPNTSLATLLSDGTPSKVDLAASGLQLREAARLTGWKWPIAGVVDGRVTGEGVLGALKTEGQVSLREGRIPLGWSDEALADAEGEFTLSGQVASLEKLVARHAAGGFRTSGTIDFTNVRDAGLKLALLSDGARITLYPALRHGMPSSDAGKSVAAGTFALELAIDGPVSSPLVSGTARLLALDIGAGCERALTWAARTNTVDFAPLWTSLENPLQLPPILARPGAPWNAWRFDIRCEGSEAAPLAGNRGTALPALRLTGTGGAPELAGSLEIRDAIIQIGDAPFTADATLTFRGGNADDPTIDLDARGIVQGEMTTVSLVGPLSHRLAFWDRAGPLIFPRRATPDLINSAAVGFSYRDEEVVTGDAPIYEWRIDGEPPIPAADAAPLPPVTVAPNP